MGLTMAWMKVGGVTCNASNEYKDGRVIDVLKPLYYSLNDDGTLSQITVAGSGCNGYSVANAADVKKYSTQQYVYVPGTFAGITALNASSSLTTSFVNTLTSFVVSIGFTGIALDIEGFSSWTAGTYSGYQALITTLGNALHAQGSKLLICGPAITSTGDQTVYQWKYEDFNSLPVDYILMLSYDYQYPHGAGTPVQPTTWLQNACAWMQAKVTNQAKIVMGIPAYGYFGVTGSTYGANITLETYTQSTAETGFARAARDSSSNEMMWANAGSSYDYSDSLTLGSKRQTIYATGLTNISVYHLGGNAWFPDVPQFSMVQL